MSIHEDFVAELKDAMKAGDKARVNVIRQIESEVSTIKTRPDFTGEVDDDMYLRTIAGYVKKMDKARREYESAGERGVANAEKLAWEITYLARWLPQALGEDETRRTVRAAIAELKADDPKMAGRVIGHVMKNSGKKLDGAMVNRIVREELGA
ncbi:MAG: GatB/YqeY domain-containing protein [Acidimicrobiia bacterium]|nr:GatB/YqeY domain-containing protein [Acidimicrobiia bacterium]